MSTFGPPIKFGRGVSGSLLEARIGPRWLYVVPRAILSERPSFAGYSCTIAKTILIVI